jgi:hypothetical protein
VVDLDLAQGVEQSLGQLGGVAVAVLGREAVPRVAGAVGEVEVADVADADDGGLLGRCGSRMLTAPPGSVKLMATAGRTPRIAA